MTPDYLMKLDSLDIETAVAEGLTDVVQELVAKNPALANHRISRETASSPYRDYGPAEYEECESVLVTAIERGWKDIALFLIENGADVNLSGESSDGCSYSVMKACKEYGDGDILKSLVAHGAVDDGSPFLNMPPRRTACEKEYGRGGNIMAIYLETVARDIESKRARDYRDAARVMADREMYKLIDKVLSLLDCPSMSEFILHHEKYVLNVSKLARDDYEFIMNKSDMSWGNYINFNNSNSAPAQWRFISMAISHSVNWNKSFEPEFDENAKPVLGDFCKEIYGDLYDENNSRPLLAVYEGLRKRYLALFPEEEVKRDVAPGRCYDDYDVFEKIHHGFCHFTANLRTEWVFDWNSTNTINRTENKTI